MKPLFIARQGRRPSGLLGHVVAGIMAGETSPENDNALALLALSPDDRLVELGCGHGAALAKAARSITRGKLAGVDFSEVMIGHARRRNRALVRSGQLALHLGPTDRLPFADGAFTAALSVHTIYFWRDPIAHLREVRRILVLGGRFVLGFRSAEDPSFAASYPSEVYSIRPKAEVFGLIRSAGFNDVREHAASRKVVLALATA